MYSLITPDFESDIHNATSIRYENHNLLQRDHKYQVMIGVQTAPSNFLQRWTIRSTWLSYPEIKTHRNDFYLFKIKCLCLHRVTFSITTA